MHVEKGTKFGRWVVLRDYPNVTTSEKVECRCICGVVLSVNLSNMRQGFSQSCGCLKADLRAKHSRSKDPVYLVFMAMRQRCYNPNAQNFYRYGGRGITVCDRWLANDGFNNFIADMGERPPGMTIERKNNDLGYTPDNCEWAPRKTQYANRSSNNYIEFRGERLTITEWAERIGLATPNLISRLNILKWPLERALTEPPNHKFGHRKKHA